MPERGGVFVSPLQAQVYIPMTGMRDAMHSPAGKKGTWRADCELLPGLDWSFVGVPCSGVEYVPYATHPTTLARFDVEFEQSTSQYALFLNEPDLATWTTGEMIAWFKNAQDRWPGLRWVGPCVSQIGGAAWIADFAAQYTYQLGEPLPVAALCVHCYGTAEDCQGVIGNVTALGASWGIPTWVTEFGYPQGSEPDAIRECGELAAWMDAHPHVARWAYWPGTNSGPEDFDWAFWKPLVSDGKLTAIGRAFVYEWPGGD